MGNIFKLLALGSVFLILLFGCGTPPEDSTKQGPNASSNQEILKKKIERETQKVARLLQKTGAKLQDTAEKIGDNQINEKMDLNSESMYKENKDSSQINDIAKLKQEALKSVQKDPLYQALSILERVKQQNNTKRDFP